MLTAEEEVYLKKLSALALARKALDVKVAELDMLRATINDQLLPSFQPSLDAATHTASQAQAGLAAATQALLAAQVDLQSKRTIAETAAKDRDVAHKAIFAELRAQIGVATATLESEVAQLKVAAQDAKEALNG